MNKLMLIIGDCCDDKWIGGFLRNCAFHDDSIDVYCANTNYSTRLFKGHEQICKEIYNVNKNAPSFLYKIPVVRRLLYFYDIRILLKSVFKTASFDVINVHYIIPELATVNLKAHTKCLILTPWGSDILRRSKLELFLLKSVFNRCQYIAVPKTRFRNDIKLKLRQPESKFVDLGMATDIVDYIIENQNYTKEQAKCDLGQENKYIIVCGYNAHPEQNHFHIIDALYTIKDKLPSNTVLLFPMTYGAPESYKESVRHYCENKQLDSVILKDFLSQKELLSIRKCADIFIHAQQTDNNSGSLAEHLLCGSKVINASWLKYPQYENKDTSYYIFNTFDDLPSVIMEAVEDENSVISPNVKEYIENMGWNKMSRKWRSFINRVLEKV